MKINVELTLNGTKKNYELNSLYDTKEKREIAIPEGTTIQTLTQKLNSGEWEILSILKNHSEL